MNLALVDYLCHARSQDFAKTKSLLREFAEKGCSLAPKLHGTNPVEKILLCKKPLKFELLEYLISNFGASCQAPDKQKALIYTYVRECEKGFDFMIAQTLIDSGSDPLYRDENGCTAIELINAEGKPGTVEKRKAMQAFLKARSD